MRLIEFRLQGEEPLKRALSALDELAEHAAVSYDVVREPKTKRPSLLVPAWLKKRLADELRSRGVSFVDSPAHSFADLPPKKQAELRRHGSDTPNGLP